MRTDDEIKQDVERELEWDAGVDERRIGVSVVDGIVALTGEVGSFIEKWTAERAAERVGGVRGVANDTEVHLSSERTDSDVAEAAANALEWNASIPVGKVKVRVQNGWLTLEGEVDWDYQRRAADRSVRHLRGVKAVTNLITVKPRVEPQDVRKRVEGSFARQAQIDADHVTVQASGGEVTLRGSVRSWAERRAAQNAAWAAPGVHAVHNNITVDRYA